MANVLIVDDDAFSSKPLADFLNKHGHSATTLPNGREALAAVITAPPDVVVLDLLMPEMDGPTFLEVVRSYLRLQALPVVVLTGVPDTPMVDRAQHLKVNSVLLKGKASMDDIKHAVEEAAARHPG